MNYYPFFLDQTFLIMIPSIMYTVPYSGFSLINLLFFMYDVKVPPRMYTGGGGVPPQNFQNLTVRSRSLTTAVEKETKRKKEKVEI